MNAVTLELSIEETNLVLEALGAMPFVRVYALVGKIQQQAQSQLQEGVRADDPGSGGSGLANAGQREPSA